MNMITLRPAITTDLPRINQILNELDLAYPGQTDKDYWVLEEDRQIKAIAKWQDLKDYYFLSSLGVAPQFQKQGLGKKILEHFMADQDKDIYIYTLIPDFFKKYGFEPIKLAQDLPIKSIFDCHNCYPNKCVCMVRTCLPAGREKMLPDFPNFQDIESKDIALITTALKQIQPQICELNIANILIWKDFDRPQITDINQNLCVLINSINEDPFFLPPIGSHNLKETIDICLKHVNKVSRVPEHIIDQLPIGQYKIKCLRSHFDYEYLTKSLAHLSGRKFDGKRNHIKNFHKKHPNHQFRELTIDDKVAALALFEQWFGSRKETQYFQKLAYTAQKSALTKAFELYNELNMIGGAMIIDDKLSGFIMGSGLNTSTISAHFQYALPGIQGIYPALLQQACQKTFSQFEKIDLEQDLGIVGLRKSKLSYYPEKIVKKFEITL